MKILIVSQNGEETGLACKLQSEGHEVQVSFIKDTNCGLNIIKKVSLKDGLMNNPDLVVIGDPNLGEWGDKLKASGINVIGASAWSQKMEDESFREKALDTFKIKTPKKYTFKNTDDAVDFIKQQSNVYVLRFKDETFVPKNVDHMNDYMDYKIGIESYRESVVVQEYIKGTEITTEIWYAKGKEVPRPMSSIDLGNSKLFNMDTSSCVVYSYPTREPRVVQQSFKKIRPFMERIEYTGCLSIKGMVKNGKFYAISIKTKMSMPRLYAMSSMLKEGIGDFLMRVVKGDSEPMDMKQGYGYSVCLHLPETFKKSYIGDLNSCDPCKVFPYNVQCVEGKFCTTGGAIFYIASSGETVKEAEHGAYETFQSIGIVNRNIRLDNWGMEASKNIKRIGDNGYEIPPFVRENQGEIHG